MKSCCITSLIFPSVKSICSWKPFSLRCVWSLLSVNKVSHEGVDEEQTQESRLEVIIRLCLVTDLPPLTSPNLSRSCCATRSLNVLPTHACTVLFCSIQLRSSKLSCICCAIPSLQLGRIGLSNQELRAPSRLSERQRCATASLPSKQHVLSTQRCVLSPVCLSSSQSEQVTCLFQRCIALQCCITAASVHSMDLNPRLGTFYDVSD